MSNVNTKYKYIRFFSFIFSELLVILSCRKNAKKTEEQEKIVATLKSVWFSIFFFLLFLVPGFVFVSFGFPQLLRANVDWVLAAGWLRRTQIRK